MAGDENSPDKVESGDAGKPQNDKSGQGRRGRYRNRKGRQAAQAAQAAPKLTPFVGRCDALKGHIYDCADIRQSDQFTKTTEEISGYVGTTYKKGDNKRRVPWNR